MDEVELDHHHSCPLHGESSESVHCVGEFRDTVVDDVANIEYCHTKVTARCMTYCVLKASCVCFLGLLCLFSGEVQALDL